MGRLLLIVPLLVLVFLAGVAVGRRRERRRAERVWGGVRPVVAAARNLAAADWVASPADTSLRVRTLQAALDDYDDDQRWGALH